MGVLRTRALLFGVYVRGPLIYGNFLLGRRVWSASQQGVLNTNWACQGQINFSARQSQKLGGFRFPPQRNWCWRLWMACFRTLLWLWYSQVPSMDPKGRLLSKPRHGSSKYTGIILNGYNIRPLCTIEPYCLPPIFWKQQFRPTPTCPLVERPTADPGMFGRACIGTVL